MSQIKPGVRRSQDNFVEALTVPLAGMTKGLEASGKWLQRQENFEALRRTSVWIPGRQLGTAPRQTAFLQNAGHAELRRLAKSEI